MCTTRVGHSLSQCRITSPHSSPPYPFARQTTGLSGLAVVNNPHHRLTVLYEKIQRVLAKMPADAAYRTSTETIVAERHAAVQAVREGRGQVIGRGVGWKTDPTGRRPVRK